MVIRNYILASIALGMISCFGSEAFFWSAPVPDTTLAELVFVFVPYILAAAAALSAVAVTSCGGPRGAFLGGAMLGYLVEGAVVATMYDAFPFQLVWTPLAWHALITGVLVFALVRASATFGLVKQVAFMAALGLAGGLWAGFWPMERVQMPSAWVALAYLGVTGALVPIGNMMLDRIGVVPRPPRGVLLVAPVLFLLLWIAQSIADPRPQRLALPLLLGGLYWIMSRLGEGRAPSEFGRAPYQAWRHWVFLIVPVVTSVVGGLLWTHTTGIESNFVIAVAGGLISLFWLGKLARLAYIAPRASSASPKSSAPS